MKRPPYGCVHMLWLSRVENMGISGISIGTDVEPPVSFRTSNPSPKRLKKPVVETIFSVFRLHRRWVWTQKWRSPLSALTTITGTFARGAREGRVGSGRLLQGGSAGTRETAVNPRAQGVHSVRVLCLLSFKNCSSIRPSGSFHLLARFEITYTPNVVVIVVALCPCLVRSLRARGWVCRVVVPLLARDASTTIHLGTTASVAVHPD